MWQNRWKFLLGLLLLASCVLIINVAWTKTGGLQLLGYDLVIDADTTNGIGIITDPEDLQEESSNEQNEHEIENESEIENENELEIEIENDDDETKGEAENNSVRATTKKVSSISLTTALRATTQPSPLAGTTTSREIAADSKNSGASSALDTNDSRGGPFNVSKTEATKIMMTVDMSHGRTGNTMFQYASLRGIAARNNRVPVLLNPPEKVAEFASWFVLHPDVISQDPDVTNRTFVYFKEKDCCKYDNRTDDLPATDLEIGKFLQSYKYFQGVESYIKKELQFQKPIRDKARAFLLANATRDTNTSADPMTYVGVHVRNKFDQWQPDETGRMSTPVGYYQRAMSYFRSRFPRVQFVMTCCNPVFCKNELMGSKGDVVVSEGMSPVEDLAILASCDHTIMSAGTFSWWAAYLAGGVAVYHAGYPGKGSKLDARFSREDYYPPQWIPIH